jgi:hypothetical protein
MLAPPLDNVTMSSPAVIEPKRIGQGEAGPGRKKGSVNRVTGLLKDAILKAAEEAGGADGLIGYLRTQAIENPAPFLALLGRVLPLQMTGESDEPVQVVIFKNVYEADERAMKLVSAK